MTTPHARTTSCKPGLLVAFTKDDIALQLSIDGAQLYRDKGCRIAGCSSGSSIIFTSWTTVVQSLLLSQAALFPVPINPREIDSYLFPSLYHLVAMTTRRDSRYSTRLHLQRYAVPFPSSWSHQPMSPGAALDVPGLLGTVANKWGAECTAGLLGGVEMGTPHYYPVMLLKPDSYMINGCSHEDVTFNDLQSFRQNISATYRKETCGSFTFSSEPLLSTTGIASRQDFASSTLFSGVTTLGVPGIFTMDLMHLSVLNDPASPSGTVARQHNQTLSAR